MAVAEPKPQFKLKRFTNVDPRTSTKRGENPYMAVGGGQTAKPHRSATDLAGAAEEQQ